jgi:phosphatidylinositol alpha-1,6-mannosyltransferase
MSKRILLFTENFPPIEGGSGRWFWELYRRLPAKDIVIVTSDINATVDMKRVDESIDATVVRIPLKSAEWGFKSLQGLKFYFQALLKLKKLVKKYNIDEVHCGRVIHEGVTAWLLNCLTGTRYRCFIHGEDVETAATSREQSLMVKQVCKRATSLICNSENSKGLTQRLGFDEGQKCIVLHPGADVDRFVISEPDASFRQKMGWQDRFVLLTVGRLQQRKGQDFLIQALPDMLRSVPNALYVVVGSGECDTQLQQSVLDLGLEDKVQFLSDLDDRTLIACYQQCDYFILPNRTIGNDIEGFGMVLVEAQACGKPVIAGDSGGTAETMNIGVTGHIVDCSKVDGLAEQLVPILTKPAQSAEHYRQHVLDNFTWQSHLEKFKKHVALPQDTGK